MVIDWFVFVEVLVCKVGELVFDYFCKFDILIII